MPEIILGRGERDLEEFGKTGTIFIGKQYIKMGQTISLSNKVFLDVVRPHVILICGKRGEGKSYTMSQFAEGMATLPKEISQNIAALFFDTVGIFWTMKYPNYRDEELLRKWGMEPKGLKNVKVFVPFGKFKQMKGEGLPVDEPFSISVSELGILDWTVILGVKPTEPLGILLGDVLIKLKERGEKYGLEDIVSEIEKEDVSEDLKKALKIRMETVKEFGILQKNGTPMNKFIQGGTITILDLSAYTHLYGSFSIRDVVMALISKKILEERERARKLEELEEIEKGFAYYTSEEVKKKKMPIVWMFIDEVHEFLPRKGSTLSTGPLLQIIREGRQPGIGLIVATQQPGKMHTDVLTQCDLVVAHRVTAKLDIDALNMIMQTFMSQEIGKYIDELPRVKGCAVVLDQNKERIYPVQMRPKFTWHGGETPTAIPPKVKI